LSAAQRSAAAAPQAASDSGLSISRRIAASDVAATDGASLAIAAAPLIPTSRSSGRAALSAPKLGTITTAAAVVVAMAATALHVALPSRVWLDPIG